MTGVQTCALPISQRLSLDHATVLSLLSSRGSANCATYSSVHHSSGTVSVRSLLLFYSQILGDYDTLVAEYVSEGNYRAAIGSLWFFSIFTIFS